MKVVIMQFGILKSYGGKMNLFVQPSYGFKVPFVETELSIALKVVVPTEQILRFSLSAVLQFYKLFH